jgi:hypothetical protein
MLTGLLSLRIEAHPARLSEPWFIGGLLVFVVVMFAWLIVLLGHFRRGA